MGVFYILAFSSPTKATASNFRSCCSDLGAFLPGLPPGGRGFPIWLPCWKKTLTFSSVTTSRAQNFLLPLTLVVPLDG